MKSISVMEPPKAEQVTLYYREGSSHKVYQCAIEPKGECFVVSFAYGRRGATLQIGTKTSSPVDYATAKRTFDKLVSEKRSKGYTEGPEGIPYQSSEKACRVSRILPQLLNPIEESELERFIADANWCLQEKFDGRRMLAMKTGEAVSGINRKGLVTSLPETVVKSAQALPGSFILDGETVDDTLHAFDLLSLNQENLTAKPYQERLLALMNLVASGMARHIQLVDTAYRSSDKARMLTNLREEKREGVVFKQLDAPYTPGRPNSGGSQRKHKFYATLSAVVANLNSQRSVELRLLNADGWQPAGNVTIPPNHPIPKVGSVVEVRYLYAMPDSGSLYQPVYLGLRNDVAQHECVTSQLKFKAEDE